MILRRITKHLTDQNWFAVGLDFFIVVIGVFIGIQMANWNANNANQQAYYQAAARLDTEITSNLKVLTTLDQTISDELLVVQAGLDALVACNEDQESMKAVDSAIKRARGTRGLHLRKTALAQLTTNPTLLSQQSNRERARFADLLFYLQVADDSLTPFQPIPLATWPAHSPTVSIHPAETYTGLFYGIEYQVPRYPITLDVAIAEACKDMELQKWLHTWEVWHSNVLILGRKLHHEYEKTRVMLLELRR